MYLSILCSLLVDIFAFRPAIHSGYPWDLRAASISSRWSRIMSLSFFSCWYILIFWFLYRSVSLRSLKLRPICPLTSLRATSILWRRGTIQLWYSSSCCSAWCSRSLGYYSHCCFALALKISSIKCASGFHSVAEAVETILVFGHCGKV